MVHVGLEHIGGLGLEPELQQPGESLLEVFMQIWKAPQLQVKFHLYMSIR